MSENETFGGDLMFFTTYKNPTTINDLDEPTILAITTRIMVQFTQSEDTNG
jgi:hypothetical protein